MNTLKLATKLSLLNTFATVFIVGIVLFAIYRYFTFVAERNIINDMGNIERSVLIVHTPFGPQYIVTRWDLYAADAESKEIISDPYGIGVIDTQGFQRIDDRYFYFVKYQKIVIGRDITPTMKFLYSIRTIFVVAILFIGLFIFLSTYALSHSSVRDLREFINEIENLGGTDLAYRINVKSRSSEVSELISKFNDLMGRIERSYRSQESFVSAVSHELRTPVTNLLGYVSMLKRWGTKDEKILNEAVNAIEESSKEIKEIIENMLLIARVDSLTEERIDLKQFIDDIITHKFKEKEIYINGNGTMKTHKEGLGIILTILLSNAFTHGAAPVILHLSNEKIEVENHGEKIPEEDLDKIFERFYKGKNSDGTGLGLYIAKEIATKLGLKIMVSSTDERTVFTVQRGDTYEN
ncbi:MAG: sensor histidine kinase [Fervidobacterium sp.]